MLKVNKQVRKFVPTSTPKQSSLVKCKVTLWRNATHSLLGSHYTSGKQCHQGQTLYRKYTYWLLTFVLGSFFLLTSDMAKKKTTMQWSLTLFPAAFFLGSPNKASNERKHFPATYIKQLQLNYVRLIHSTYKRNHLWTGRTDIATV